MENSYKYTVAGHTFCISLPEGFDKETYLAPYSPFEDNASDAKPVTSLRVELCDRLKDKINGPVKEVLNDEPPYFWLYDRGETVNPFADARLSDWFFGFSYSKKHPDCVLVASEDFSEAVVYVPSAFADRLVEFALSNSMMLLYTFTTSAFDTLMIHASVIRKDGRGYVFLGKSGTGKSTHSSLWLKYIEGSNLLNDDNPVIRIVDGQAYVYGSPWSGKTPCYKNEVVPLGGIVRLSQAPYNKISRLFPLHAYAALMPSCSCMRWDSVSYEALHKSVEKVIMQVPCWHLECLPDEDAAWTCHNAVTPSVSDK